MTVDHTARQVMGRLLRGQPEPEASEQQTDSEPQSAREWFDRIVRGVAASEPELEREPSDAA